MIVLRKWLYLSVVGSQSISRKPMIDLWGLKVWPTKWSVMKMELHYEENVPKV